jgi:hypothetical protein
MNKKERKKADPPQGDEKAGKIYQKVIHLHLIFYRLKRIGDEFLQL